MVKTVAHRGYSGKYPENTVVALREAARLCVEMVELDVIPSADGEIMVIHDQTVNRTTDGTGRVVEMPFEALRRLDAGCRRELPGQKIPTLQEAIDATGSSVELNINLKFFDHFVRNAREEKLMRDYEERVVKIVADLGAMERSFFAIHPEKQIERIRALAPQCNAILLFWRDGDHYIRRSAEMGLKVTQPDCDLMSPQFVASLHEAGLVGNVFYANTADDMKSFILMGIDGILTDEPELLLQVRQEFRN